jgi:signal transduction histidine kinase
VDIETQSALLAAIVCLAIAISIQIRGRRTRLTLYFSVLNAVLSAWNLTGFLYQVSEQEIWFRLGLLAALAIPWSATRFFQAFLAESSRLASGMALSSTVVSVLLLPLVLSPLYSAPAVSIIILFYVFVLLYLCMYMIYRRLRLTESRIEGARLGYLVIGGLVAITFSLTDFLPKIDILFPTVGNVLTLIFVFFLNQILIQFRLLDLTEFFGKIVVLALLVSVLAAVYGVLVLLAGDQPGILFFASIVGSFVVLILHDPLRIAVEAAIARYSVRERFDLVKALTKLRREMANALELAPMVQLVLDRFENSRRLTHAALFLLDDDAQSYKCLGSVGPQRVSSCDVLAKRELFEALRKGRWLVREDIEDDLHELGGIGEPAEENSGAAIERLETFLRAMDELGAGVLFPIASDQLLIGFLAVDDARVREAFTQDELNALQQVAQQIAIAVENSRLVEKLRERDRLAALGEMAAGLAHEIRNPLSAIKGAAQLLESGAEAEEAKDFLNVIVEETNRLNNVVAQFLDYARPSRSKASSLDLNHCIEHTLQVLRQRAEEAEVELETELCDALPPVRGESEQLTQVFLNLAINAIEAMSESELKVLRIRSLLAQRREQALGGTILREVVEARFEDTGRGMSAEELHSIFIPFYTTKPTGTGLGLPICQRIVRSFGGSLEAHSEVGNGSSFSVVLPVWGEESITGTGMRRLPNKTQ